MKNGTETDIDCGGATCGKCAATKACAAATDCASGVCTGNVCQAPLCTDLAKNGTETDVDCGGTCATKRKPGKTCAVNADGTTASCVGSKCALDATFTTCGKTLETGPSQAACDAAYPAGHALASAVLLNAGIQEWAVPVTGTYEIDAAGAQGGDHNYGAGGLGANLTGELALTAGNVLRILVGQRGKSGPYHDVGGGGGTFVSMGATPLLVAAGGGEAGGSTGKGGLSDNAGLNPTRTSGSNLGAGSLRIRLMNGRTRVAPCAVVVNRTSTALNARSLVAD